MQNDANYIWIVPPYMERFNEYNFSNYSALSFISLGFCPFTKLPSMANTNPSVRACVLKVDVKCCSGCQKKATRKLQSLSGVSAAEYNAVKGLMTVTGDMDPMTLVQKLTRWGRKTELVSVNYTLDDLISDEDEDQDEDEDEDEDQDDTSSDDTSSNMRTTMKKKEGRLRKYLLFGCLRSKSKVVQPPSAKINFGSSRFGNVSDFGGYGNRQPPPRFHGPMNPQQQQMMMQQQQQPGLPQHSGMIYPAFSGQTGFALLQPAKPNPKMTVNSGLHYPAT